MFIVPERDIADLMTREAAFDAVEKVFAAMASGDAYNFPVVREAIGHEDALYGFKGGFDRAGLTLGLKAGGYWPNNLEKRGIINHQSTVFLFDPDTGKAKAMVGGNLLTALRTAAASSVSIKHLARKDAKVIGMVGAGHQAQFRPDLTREACDRGLAVGAGDGDHHFRLRPEPEGRGIGQRGARVFGHDKRGLGRGQFVSGDPRAFAVGQDRGGFHAQGVLDEFPAVQLGPRQRGKKMPRLDGPAVYGKPCDFNVLPTLGPKTECRER